MRFSDDAKLAANTDQPHELDRHNESDQVGTVEVQILLSWFFETSRPSDLAIDLHDAA